MHSDPNDARHAAELSDDDVERARVQDRIEQWRKRAPRLTDEVVTMAHGAGGRASQTLLDAVIRPALSNAVLDGLDDGAILDVAADGRLVMTTDGFVVQPRSFPGGTIGELAVNGTVNDLAVMGAIPKWLTLAFILEEGLEISELRTMVDDVARAALAAGVEIVSGDTKVVERGAADGCYVTTTGVGWLPTERQLGADRVEIGDAVIVSGTIGDHGMAIMLARGNLELNATIESDTAPLNGLIEVLLEAVPSTRWMRDPTRGGVASACNELAVAVDAGIRLFETELPVRPAVGGACELLGIDPLHVANEGKLVAVVPADAADAAISALRSHHLGVDAAVIGVVMDDHAGLVVAETPLGGTRVVDMLVGDPLPRIC